MARKKNIETAPAAESTQSDEAVRVNAAPEGVVQAAMKDPSEVIEQMSVDVLAEHLETTGTGKNKIAIVLASKTLEDAVSALEAANFGVTAAKAREWIQQ